MNMKCPCCGAVELIHDIRDIPYIYKGETTVIPAVTGDFCPACAESILDAAESDRVLCEMRTFSKQVNAAFVQPEFITPGDQGMLKAAQPTGTIDGFVGLLAGRTKKVVTIEEINEVTAQGWAGKL